MAFMDKLRFWKKDDSLDTSPIGGDMSGFGEPSGFDQPTGMGKDPFGTPDFRGPKDSTPGMGGGNIGAMDAGTGSPANSEVSLRGPSYEKPPEPGDLRHAPLAPMEKPAYSESSSNSRELELISAKLDTIKANVESINHRLESIERVVMTQERKRVQW